MKNKIRLKQLFFVLLVHFLNISSSIGQNINTNNKTGFSIHEVKPKETIYSVSNMFNIGVDELIELNPELQEKGIQLGMLLKVPVKKEIIKHENQIPLKSDNIKTKSSVQLTTIDNTKVLKNYDLIKDGLKGRVKSIEINFQEGKIVREYNEFGKLKSIVLNDNFYDKIEDFEMTYSPKEFDDEFLVVLPFGRLKTTIHVDRGMQTSGISPKNLDYVYDSEGKLISVKNINFEYDTDGYLIEKKYSYDDNYLSNPDSKTAISKIKYKWKNGKLISKYAYNVVGDRYHEFYDIEYIGNQQIIKVSTNSKDTPRETITITRNTSGQIINKTRVSHPNYFGGKPRDYYTKYSNNYIYLNGFIVKIGNTVKVVRDNHSNILHIDKDNYNRNQYEHDTEWSYEYDEYDNWIKRTEYNVKLGDIKITKKTGEITRKVTYYQ